MWWHRPRRPGGAATEASLLITHATAMPIAPPETEGLRLRRVVAVGVDEQVAAGGQLCVVEANASTVELRSVVASPPAPAPPMATAIATTDASAFDVLGRVGRRW